MGYLLAFCIPSLLVASVWLGWSTGYADLSVGLALVAGFVVLPLVQLIWRRDPFKVSAAASARCADGSYRVLLWLTLPAQMVMVAVATAAFSSGHLSPPGQLGLLLPTAVFSASFAITAAHELIHRRPWIDRVVGGLLLSLLAFGTFKVVHLRIHHPYVGTPLDFATARRGQTIYAFWWQSLRGNSLGALRCERERLARLGQPAWRSELVVWYALTALWLVTALVLLGWVGGLFFLAQGVLASMYLDDLLLFNLPRYAHHHTQPELAFQRLRDTPVAPRYPFNYSAMTLVVLVPALFRRMAHPRLDELKFEHNDYAEAA